MDKLQIDDLIKAFELCKTAIKLLHPHLDPEEPCIAFEAYNEANNQISGLTRQRNYTTRYIKGTRIWNKK